MALTGLVAANNLSDVVDIERTWDNIGNNISATVFVPAATLDLNFAGNKSLVDNISGSGLVAFTRASSGTFVGSNGLIQNAASGVPRFDHNPTTRESLGLLVEEARTNLLVGSETFYGLYWTAVGAGDIITESYGTAPNGVANQTRRFQVGATARVLRWISGDCGIDAISTQYCFSFYYRGSLPIGIGARAAGGPAPTILFPPSGGSMGRAYGVFTSGANATAFLDITYAANSDAELWGLQVEKNASFPTSYIPTTTIPLLRSADVVSIEGSNFSRWYNNLQGTFYGEWQYSGPQKTVLTTIVGIDGNGNNGLLRPDLGNSPTPLTRKAAIGQTDFRFGNVLNYSLYSNGVSGGLQPQIAAYVGDGYPYNITIGYQTSNSVSYLNSSIKRISYYPIRLTITTLQAITTSGPVSSFPYSFSIKGRDILALKEVNKTSTRDFVFIKGLASKVQPRINTASQYTASGVALRNAAMLKVAPTTVGNYFFSSGLTLSGTTVQINGTNALSIATSPFSSSTATVPLLFAGLRPQANWRFTEPMTSGTVVSPESAIPIETSDFLLFIKAGQS